MNVNNHSLAEPENGCFLHKECDFIGRNIKNNNEKQNKKVDIKFFQDNLQKMGYKDINILCDKTIFLNKGKISEQEALR